MNTDLLKHRERADRVRQDYLAKVDAVRQDRDLSEDGRRRRLAELYTQTKSTLDESARAEEQLLSGQWRDLHEQLFGARGAMRGADLGGHAISARDASDRAAQLTTAAEAADLLARAEADGDELLARAVARRCAAASEQAMGRSQEKAWDDVTASFLDRRPTLMPVVEQLAQIEDMTKRQVFSPFAVQQPHGLTPQDLNQVAAPATGQTQSQPSDGRPLVDPSKTTTTQAQRVAWEQATGVGA